MTLAARSPAPSDGATLLAAPPAWIGASAEALDRAVSQPGAVGPAHVLVRLAGAGYMGLGIAREAGGLGGDVADALAAVAELAAQSLTVAFVYWAHRASMEVVLQSPYATRRDARLPAMLEGTRAGAPGLSNAMKHLGGIEPIRVSAEAAPDGSWRASGRVGWTTNAHPAGFDVLVGVRPPDGKAVAVAALDADTPGLIVLPHDNLLALRGSYTAALELQAAGIAPEAVLHDDLGACLAAIRAPFVGLQCGLSLGLARASLAAARASGPLARSLAGQLPELEVRLAQAGDALAIGLRSGEFREQPAALFRLRIALAHIVNAAALLELQAGGGRAYVADGGTGFARRWREAAFIPVITPTLAQLESQLDGRGQYGNFGYFG